MLTKKNKKTEYLIFNSKFTLLNTNKYNTNESENNMLICKDNSELENYQLKNKSSKSRINSSIIDRIYIYKDHKEALDNELNNSNNQQTKAMPNKNQVVTNNNIINDSYSEMYFPERYGLKYNNTFVMTFCKPSINDYFKWLFGINSYEYEDYIQYKLNKKNYKKKDVLIKTIIVEKNAFHCQGLVKKLIVIKDRNHAPKKVIFV
jgi:hypothetical protein